MIQLFEIYLRFLSKLEMVLAQDEEVLTYLFLF